MRALVVGRYGSPEVFELREMPDPQPKAGEVLIRVKAIGVNFADLLQRMGLYPGSPKPPFVPGLEIAGVVEKSAAGGGASEGPSLKAGDAVTALTQFNAYAEWAAVPARQVYRLPAGMKFDEAAAIPVNYLTAYHSMFTMGNLQAGGRILIHGAAGGVGTAAVELARARGLVVFGTAGPTKQEFLRKSGVDYPIDHEKSDFVEVVRKYAPDGIEMVMDPIGGKSFSRSYQCVGPGGRLVVYGFSAAVGPEGKPSLVGRPARAGRNAVVQPAQADGTEYYRHRRASGTVALPRRAAAKRTRRNIRHALRGHNQAGDRQEIPARRGRRGAPVHPRAKKYREGDSVGEIEDRIIVGGVHGLVLARLALWLAQSEQGSPLRPAGHSRSGAGHRRDHRHLQRD